MDFLYRIENGMSKCFDAATIEVLIRQISLDKDVPYVAVSAIQPKTLRGLVERIGERVNKFEIAQLT